MKSETLDLIEQIIHSVPFGGDGVIDAGKVVLVPDAKDALHLAASDEWSEFLARVETGICIVELQERLYKQGRQLYPWPEEVLPLLAPHDRHINVNRYDWLSRYSVHMLFMNAVTEVEFSDLLPPVFFYPRLLPILLAGHLPCGWQGDPVPENWRPSGPESMPDGKILVHLIGDDFRREWAKVAAGNGPDFL